MKRRVTTTICIALLSSAWLVGCSSNPISSSASAGAKQAQSTQAPDGDTIIPLASVPQAALDAVTATQPGGTIIAAEREDENGTTVYELHVQQPGGTVVEVETDAQGNIQSTEPAEKGRPGSTTIGT